jgi:colanic acid biosynthesis glycosyl transferase WcaI
VRILYVSQYFPPEMGAPAARAAELACHWAQDGHEVTILTGFPNHPTGVVPPEYRGRLWRLAMREEFQGARVLRTWLLPLPNRKAYERMLNYSSFCLSSAAAGLFARRPDVLIATSPQLLVGLSGWWLARAKRVPFVFEVRDLWPESLAAVGVSSRHSPLNRSLGAIAKFLYQRSDHIVVVTPAFREYLIEHWKIPAEKLSIVENGVETDLFRPEAVNPTLKEKLGLQGRFVVGYVGTMGMAHGLETVLQAARKLETVLPHVCFLMVGEGADKERVLRLARAQSLNNLCFVGQQPREKVPEFICASDVCLVLLKKSEVFKTVIPTKLLEFMSCARPVILGVEGQAWQIVEQAEAGVFMEPENANDLISAVQRLQADQELRETLGRNGRRHILRNYSRERSAKTYLAVLEAVLSGPGRRTPLAA